MYSFDIVSPIRSPAADAEMLEVVDKVISEFRGMRGSLPSDFEFHVSHESSEAEYAARKSAHPRLVLAILLTSVPDRARSSVLKSLKAIGSGVGFAQSRAVLGGIPGLPKPLLDDVEQCCVAGQSNMPPGLQAENVLR